MSYQRSQRKYVAGRNIAKASFLIIVLITLIFFLLFLSTSQLLQFFLSNPLVTNPNTSPAPWDAQCQWPGHGWSCLLVSTGTSSRIQNQGSQPESGARHWSPGLEPDLEARCQSQGSEPGYLKWGKAGAGLEHGRNKAGNKQVQELPQPHALRLLLLGLRAGLLALPANQVV